MKTYNLYAGMTGDFEIIRTDAPKSVVIDHIMACSNMELPENDPELFFKEKGYYIEFLGCQYDDIEIGFDQEIDTYDYI